jgi:hypothetical protein
MNKKLWMGAGVVFVAFGAMEFIFYAAFQSWWDPVAHLMRPEAEVKMWIVVVTWAFFAYFFAWIFSKGYENKGIMEGVRYGLAVAFMMVLPWAYNTYAYMKDFPYNLTLLWFIMGTVEMVVCGVVLAWIFAMKPKQSAG